MNISTNQQSSRVQFKNNNNPVVNSAVFLDNRVLMNKAVLDLVFDVPMVLLTNNKDEQRERASRCALICGISYATPFVTLPITNRLAMKHVAKMSKFMGKESNLIQLSNKFLKSADDCKTGLAELPEQLSKGLFEKAKKKPEKMAEAVAKKEEYSQLIKSVVEKENGDFEAIRNKIINAKNSVLSFDLLFTAGSLGSINFLNNYVTKKKTGQKGFAAEFKMADKEVVEKRAEEYKKTQPLRTGIYASALTGLALLPLGIKKGLSSKSGSKFSEFVKKHATKFDYDDGIFMKRLPFALACIGLNAGTAASSRNKTELKDGLTRGAMIFSLFFGGDMLLGSTMARLSDKYLKTDIVDKNCKPTLINKIIPPIKKLQDLSGRSKTIGAGLFWANMAIMSVAIGGGVPMLMNKMIKKDVNKDMQKGVQNQGGKLEGNQGEKQEDNQKTLSQTDVFKKVSLNEFLN
ncbi:MAG: hypothetical protein R3Y28_03115 [Candidatus Gastranaerophilales bacterium]